MENNTYINGKCWNRKGQIKIASAGGLEKVSEVFNRVSKGFVVGLVEH